MRRVIAVVFVIAAAAAGYFGYDRFQKWHNQQLEQARQEEQQQVRAKLDELENEVAALREDLAEQKGGPAAEAKLKEVYGDATLPVPGQDVSCEELDKQVRAFFAYLAQKGYGQGQAGAEDLYSAFLESLDSLAAHPPAVTAELKDLATLTQNVTHFYKGMGKERINLARRVLRDEPETLEPAMSTLFQWLMAADRCPGQDARPSLKASYEYAGFFLSTLGGRSYLIRRDSTVQALTQYYSVLVLDRANDAVLNRHGIDIRPQIQATARDIAGQRGLRYRPQYLAELDRLQAKYEANPGGQPETASTP
ncbi:MAG: hypothetical protein AB1640_15715 [bacterium]